MFINFEILQSTIMFKKIINFYVEGFKSMTVGKKLWLIIFIKLFIMFGILKVFFFERTLSDMSESQKADYVTEQLLQKYKNN